MEQNTSDARLDQPVDDFRQIRGIGPAVENLLHAAGLLSYRQLAEASPRELAEKLSSLTGFSENRIIGLKWTRQAHDLAVMAEQTLPTADLQPNHKRQHYNTFTIELLLDHENQVRRTRAVHVQEQVEVAWAGWEGQRLLDFITQNAGIPGLQERVPQSTADPLELAAAVEEPDDPFTVLSAGPGPALMGELGLKNLEPVVENQSGSKLLLLSGHPFGVRVGLDLKGVPAPKDVSLDYSASVYARKLGVGGSRIVGYKQNSIIANENTVLEIDCEPLTQGAYRLEAVVALNPYGMAKKNDLRLMAMVEGPLFYVV